MSQSPEDFRTMRATRDAERDDDAMPLFSIRVLLSLFGMVFIGAWALGFSAFTQML